MFTAVLSQCLMEDSLTSDILGDWLLMGMGSSFAEIRQETEKILRVLRIRIE